MAPAGDPVRVRFGGPLSGVSRTTGACKCSCQKCKSKSFFGRKKNALGSRSGCEILTAHGAAEGLDDRSFSAQVEGDDLAQSALSSARQRMLSDCRTIRPVRNRSSRTDEPVRIASLRDPAAPLEHGATGADGGGPRFSAVRFLRTLSSRPRVFASRRSTALEGSRGRSHTLPSPMRLRGSSGVAPQARSKRPQTPYSFTQPSSWFLPQP